MKKLTHYASLCAMLLIAFTIFSCQPESQQTDTNDESALEVGGNVALAQSASMEIISIFAQEMDKAGLVSGFESGKLTTRGGGPKVAMHKNDNTYFEASLDFGAGTAVDKRILSGKIYGKIWKKSNGELMRMILQPENLNLERHENACKPCNTNSTAGNNNFTISGCTFYKGTLTIGNVSKCATGVNRNKYLFRVKIDEAIIGTPKNKRGFGFAGLADCAMLADNGNTNYIANPTKFIDALINDYAKDSYELNILEAVGTDYKGKVYRAASRGTVVVDFACSWPKKGIMDVYCKGWMPNFSVDFGTGACDNIATMKVAGVKLPGIIKLP
jgi:hypothetical protein